jgi:aconitate decarboxylase
VRPVPRRPRCSEIEQIDIFMPEAAYGHGGWKAIRPLEPIGAQMNVAYAVAVALLDGEVLVDQFSTKRIKRRISPLMMWWTAPAPGDESP